MVKCIIFDFDGVILESLDAKANAFKQLYKNYGNTIMSKVEKHHLQNGGVSRYEKIKFYHSHYLKEKINDDKIIYLSKKFSDIVFDNVINCSFVIGVKNFLINNKEDFSLFISSASPEEELLKICKKINISPFFKRIYGSPKSKNNHILNIKRDYNLKSHEIIFVGDSINDYEAAKKNKLNFIGRLSLNTNPFPSSVHTIKNLSNFNDIIDMYNS